MFEPLTIGDVTLKNRVAVSPMSQYAATNCFANEWQVVHLGLWQDAQIAPLARVVETIRSLGPVPAIQLGHAGRK